MSIQPMTSEQTINILPTFHRCSRNSTRMFTSSDKIRPKFTTLSDTDGDCDIRRLTKNEVRGGNSLLPGSLPHETYSDLEQFCLAPNFSNVVIFRCTELLRLLDITLLVRPTTRCVTKLSFEILRFQSPSRYKSEIHTLSMIAFWKCSNKACRRLVVEEIFIRVAFCSRHQIQFAICRI